MQILITNKAESGNYNFKRNYSFPTWYFLQRIIISLNSRLTIYYNYTWQMVPVYIISRCLRLPWYFNYHLMCRRLILLCYSKDMIILNDKDWLVNQYLNRFEINYWYKGPRSNDLNIDSNPWCTCINTWIRHSQSHFKQLSIYPFHKALRKFKLIYCPWL